MSLMQSKALREKRASIAVAVKNALAEMAKADTTEARKLELRTANDAALNEADALRAQIDQIERAADLESELDSTRERGRGRQAVSADPKEARVQMTQAMAEYFRYGVAGMEDESRALLAPYIEAGRREGGKAGNREQRDIATTTSGVVLPNEYWPSIEESMLEFGGVRPVARVIRTGNGNSLVFPTVNDTANSAAIVSEAAQTTTSVDPAFSSLTLSAFTYRSFILVSRELLQDMAFDIAGWVNAGLATRLARGLNAHFTTGTNSGQPNGVVTASSAGVTSASGNSIVFNDLTQLEHSLDPAYRNGARFMMHDTTLRLLKQMVDSQSRPLWIPGIALRSPDMVLGYPYTINQQMTALSSGGVKAILFGRFDKYIVRDVVNESVILRLAERYADYGQVGFFLFSRHDGDLLDAGTDPLKHLVTPTP